MKESRHGRRRAETARPARPTGISQTCADDSALDGDPRSPGHYRRHRRRGRLGPSVSTGARASDDGPGIGAAGACGKQTELAAVNGSLAAVRLTHDTATTRSASLKDRVADQSACIDAQANAREAISGITELQIDTFNLTTKESVWAKAQAARLKALGRAATNYFNAYKSAFFGNTSAAAGSYRKGQADEATADSQRKIQDAELAKVSANNVKILAALDAFSATLATATSACATN